MLESLLLSAQCVFPVLILIALGMLIRKMGWLTDDGISQMDKVVFRILLPVLLFQNIYTADFRTGFQPALLVYAAAFSLASFVISIIWSGIVEKNPPRRAALAQGMFRNNGVVYGLPIITAIYGSSAVGTFSMLLALVIPMNNILAVVILTSLSGSRFQPLKTLKSVVTNPYVISAVLALGLKFCGVQLPKIITSVTQNLGQAATPVAMLLLGASLRFSAVRDYQRDIIWGVLVKLIGLSVLLLPIAIAFGVRGVPLVSLYLSIGTPCAVSSHIMAKQMGADGDLAGHLVVFGALGSIVTIFLTLTVLGTFGLI